MAVIGTSEVPTHVSDLSVFYDNITEDIIILSGTLPVSGLDAWTIVMAFILALTALTTCFGNILVLVAFYVEKKIRTNFNIFIVNLAVTDLIVSLSMALYTLDLVNGFWAYGEVLCGVWIFCDWGMTFASIFTLVAISVDRYWAACWSLNYRTNNTKKRIFKFIALVWLLMAVLWVPPFILDRVRWSQPGHCIWAVANNREFALFVAVGGYHGPSLLMVFCYIKVYQTMKRRQATVGPNIKIKVRPVSTMSSSDTTFNHDQISNIQSTVSSRLSQPATEGQGHSETKRSFEKEKNIFVSLSYIIICYIICWSPFHLVFDILYVNDEIVSAFGYALSVWLCYLNSCLNPFLYALSSKDIRVAFIKVLKCSFMKRKICKSHG